MALVFMLLSCGHPIASDWRWYRRHQTVLLDCGRGIETTTSFESLSGPELRMEVCVNGSPNTKLLSLSHPRVSVGRCKPDLATRSTGQEQRGPRDSPAGKPQSASSTAA